MSTLICEIWDECPTGQSARLVVNVVTMTMSVLVFGFGVLATSRRRAVRYRGQPYLGAGHPCFAPLEMGSDPLDVDHVVMLEHTPAQVVYTPMLRGQRDGAP
eukprot:2635161-Amphidinium_carterae.1